MPSSTDSGAIARTGFGLNHVGLVVSDLQRAHDFYVDVVGMQEEGVSELSSESFDRLMNRDGLRIKFWYLKLKDFRLQLIEYLCGAGEPLNLDHSKSGCPHLCFEVLDAQEKFEQIKRRGDVKITSEVVTSHYGAMVAHSFYVEDPDGVPIEFGQIERMS